jgi:hypothetical protein
MNKKTLSGKTGNYLSEAFWIGLSSQNNSFFPKEHPAAPQGLRPLAALVVLN